VARLVMLRTAPEALAVLVCFMVFCWSYGFSWTLAVPAGWALVTAYRAQKGSAALVVPIDELTTTTLARSRR
jgi:hypothetical protein